MIRIYGDLNSGNCLKVKYLCDHLGLPYCWVPVDIMKGETRSPDFLARNPMGQVPVIELMDDVERHGDGRARDRGCEGAREAERHGPFLAQSNAILLHLAEGSPLLPGAGFKRAKITEWLFWEQYSHEPYIAVCRFHMVYEGRAASEREAWRVARGEAALARMDRHLDQRDWLVDGDFSIADIALLAYSRLAPEGGFDLSPLPALRRWITRSEQRLGLPALNTL